MEHDRERGVTTREDRRGLTPAQLHCPLAGLALLGAGVFGFISNSDFTTGNDIDGGSFLGFEVNGWHNLVHIASGLLGLALWRSVSGARSYALGFGAVYLIVTLWGFIDGNDVLNLIPVNPADNWLHVALTIAALLIAVVSGGLLASGRRAG